MLRSGFDFSAHSALENSVFSDENRAKRPEIQTTSKPSGPRTFLFRAPNLPSQSLWGPGPTFSEPLKPQICLCGAPTFLIRALGAPNLPPRSLESTISYPLGPRGCLHKVSDASDMPLQSPEAAFTKSPMLQTCLSRAPNLPSQSPDLPS